MFPGSRSSWTSPASGGQAEQPQGRHQHQRGAVERRRRGAAHLQHAPDAVEVTREGEVAGDAGREAAGVGDAAIPGRPVPTREQSRPPRRRAPSGRACRTRPGAGPVRRRTGAGRCRCPSRRSHSMRVSTGSTHDGRTDRPRRRPAPGHRARARPRRPSGRARVAGRTGGSPGRSAHQTSTPATQPTTRTTPRPPARRRSRERSGRGVAPRRRRSRHAEVCAHDPRRLTNCCAEFLALTAVCAADWTT